MYEPKALSYPNILFDEAASFILITTCPLSMLFYWITYQYFDAQLSLSAAALFSEGPAFFSSRLPLPTTASIWIYMLWVLTQAVLYIFLPGPLHKAPRTHGGRRLTYKLNGLTAWFVTVGVAIVVSYLKLIDPAYIAKNWGELLAAANVYCVALIVVFWIKARIRPDLDGETLFTGHFWYDLFNGGELHPRTGSMFDWKHFNASRTGGILLWTLIDLSFAALQYSRYGAVTNSMVLAVIFRMIITTEYFYTEKLFFETLDGAHERFSFYNIYGFAAIMPQIWTLQTHYLVTHPVDLSKLQALAIILAFAAGWTLNHVANDQKNLSRETNGQCEIWGEKAKFIEATFKTADGKTHRTLLLTSGWWGVVRHANYVGSLLYTWASCFTCGTAHAFPYTEAILVTLTVIHRCWRDEARCKEKYGEKWDEYCQKVRWRMIPGIF